MALSLLLGFIWDFITTWWWVFLPFFLYKPLIFFWLFWRKDIYTTQQRSVLLEIKMPQLVEKPLKGMEDVFAGLWQIHDPANPRETWLEGKYQASFAIEIVSTEGDVHFYLRIPNGQQNLVRSAIYSQYPAVELEEVEDYTKYIPRDIPNKDWDLWGTSFILEKPSPYPIKTYSKFFEPVPDIKEEKRIDPLAALIEGMSTIGKGENLWVQLVIKPILHTEPSESTLVEDGKKIIAELVRRPPVKQSSLMGDIGQVGATIITGKVAEQREERQEIIPPEMRLTPGERDIVASIEEKISKYAFQVHSRFIYLYRRENYFGPVKAIPMSFFTRFSTATYNNFRPLKPTLTKVYTVLTMFFDKRRVFVRKRKLFRHYVSRVSPFFPRPGGTFVLNIEELATIFHFLGTTATSSASVSRVPSKKGEAPSGLPTE